MLYKVSDIAGNQLYINPSHISAITFAAKYAHVHMVNGDAYSISHPAATDLLCLVGTTDVAYLAPMRRQARATATSRIRD
jgi:hypothetical protein